MRYSNFEGQMVEWTDYTKCASVTVTLQRRRAYVHVTAYAISIVTILPAIIIFFCYKWVFIEFSWILQKTVS